MTAQVQGTGSDLSEPVSYYDAEAHVGELNTRVAWIWADSDECAKRYNTESDKQLRRHPRGRLSLFLSVRLLGKRNKIAILRLGRQSKPEVKEKPPNRMEHLRLPPLHTRGPIERHA